MFTIGHHCAPTNGKNSILVKKVAPKTLFDTILVGTSFVFAVNKLKNLAMFINMLKITWRNSITYLQFTLLNTLGLSIGITTCLLIGLYVFDEMNYDAFHEHADRIYRINQPQIWQEWDGKTSTTGPNVGIALRSDIPEFEEVTRVLHPGAFTVAYKPDNGEPISLVEENLLVAEENFFDIFSFNLIKGNPITALQGPSKVVITEEMAKKYFGDEDPVGKILEMKGTILESSQSKEEKWNPFTVTGVVEEIKNNSHIQFDMLTSMSSYQVISEMEWTWSWTAFVNYVLVKEGADLIALENKLQAVPPKWAASTLERVFNQSFDDLEDQGKAWTLYLEPLDEVYFSSWELGNTLGPAGNTQYIKIFSSVGILIMILSSINFMNMSTARSANRAREVGIRKVLGSDRKRLIRQFLIESVLYTSVSAILAIGLTEMVLDFFNHIAHKQLSLYAQWSNPAFIAILLAFILGLGLLAGSYPAYYLSAFKPAETLKGKIGSGFKGKGIRNTLVVFQFTISITLIISTFFVNNQLNYALNFDLGYDKNNVLQVHNIEQLEVDVTAIKQIFSSDPAFILIGQSHEVPPTFQRGDIISAMDKEDEQVETRRMKSDTDYINLLDLKFVSGRNFDEGQVTDISEAVILNVSAIKSLGWGIPETYPDDPPIGKFVVRNGKQMKVIGVVEDFHFNNLKMAIAPLVIYHINNPHLPDSGTSPSYLSFRIDPKVINDRMAIQSMIVKVKDQLHGLNPFYQFKYSFMDEVFENSYRNEQRMSSVLSLFTLMSITIACIGLFGLAAFSAEQRTKELGIRKVLGAKVSSLVILFTSEFTKLVIMAVLIASALAYYIIKVWLTGFAYKAPIEPWVFLVAGATALIISWLTIGFQAIKSAYTNPIESLRDD